MSYANLEIVNLCAGYRSQVVIKDITLSIKATEWFVLLGPNGCGKSTFLNCVAGKHAPISGDIRIFGARIQSDPQGAKRQLGYSCSPDSLPKLLTGRQCLEIHAAAKGIKVISSDLIRLAEELRFSRYLDTFVDTMSLGTRQKLCVLLALVADPMVVILDEAFNGLDPSSSLVLKRHLRWRLEQFGACVLLATHALDVVEHHADRTGILMRGEILREWSKADIEAIALNPDGIESALAEATINSGWRFDD
jgi:ABC-2 type transport system ATP-binding protein